MKIEKAFIPGLYKCCGSGEEGRGISLTDALDNWFEMYYWHNDLVKPETKVGFLRRIFN